MENSSTKKSRKSIIPSTTLRPITKAMWQTFLGYCFILLLVSIALFKLTGLVSVGHILTLLIVWSIVFPLKSLAILSLLHILFMSKFLRIVLGTLENKFLITQSFTDRFGASGGLPRLADFTSSISALHDL